MSVKTSIVEKYMNCNDPRVWNISSAASTEIIPDKLWTGEGSQEKGRCEQQIGDVRQKIEYVR